LSCSQNSRAEDVRQMARARTAQKPTIEWARFDVGKHSMPAWKRSDPDRRHGPYLALKLVSNAAMIFRHAERGALTSGFVSPQVTSIRVGKVFLSSRTRRSGSRAASLLRMAPGHWAHRDRAGAFTGGSAPRRQGESHHRRPRQIAILFTMGCVTAWITSIRALILRDSLRERFSESRRAPRLPLRSASSQHVDRRAGCFLGKGVLRDFTGRS